MSTPVLYTTTPVAVPAGTTLMTAPRPLPGVDVGYRGGSGFKVFLVGDEFRDGADRLDGRPIVVRTEAWEAEQVAGHEYAEAYLELVAAGDMTVRQIVGETTDQWHVTLELNDDGRTLVGLDETHTPAGTERRNVAVQ